MFKPFIFLISSCVLLGACSSVSEAIKGPSLSNLNYPAALVPTTQTLLAQPDPQSPASANSLWRAGSRTFFNDQRARRVGDILTVMVDIDDSAQTANATQGSRSNSYNAKTPSIFGLESSLGKILPGAYDPANALDSSGNASLAGSGTIKRSEKISLTIAAVVTGVLPNGNMIIQGSQEVRTNREVRVLSVSGIARPEDVTSVNTLKHTQLAEARINYGGRGDMTNMNTPPAAQNIINRFSPF